MEQLEKEVVVPIVHINHNSDETGLAIRVDIAGASKESIDLEVGTRGFCVKAEADDFRYENCFTLGHEVVGEDARAKFRSGLLTITVPFKDGLHGHKVRVE